MKGQWTTSLLLFSLFTPVVTETITKTLMVVQSGNGTDIAELWESNERNNDPNGNKHLQDIDQILMAGTFRSTEIDTWANNTPTRMIVALWSQQGDMLFNVVFRTSNCAQRQLDAWMTVDRILFSSNKKINNETAAVRIGVQPWQMTISKRYLVRMVWVAIGDWSVMGGVYLLAHSQTASSSGIINPVYLKGSNLKFSSAVHHWTTSLSKRTKSVYVSLDGVSTPLYVNGISVSLYSTKNSFYVVDYLLKYSHTSCDSLKTVKESYSEDQEFKADGTVTVLDVIPMTCIKIIFLEYKNIKNSQMDVNISYVTGNSFMKASYLSFVGEWDIDNTSTVSSMMDLQTTQHQSLNEAIDVTVSKANVDNSVSDIIQSEADNSFSTAIDTIADISPSTTSETYNFTTLSNFLDALSKNTSYGEQHLPASSTVNSSHYVSISSFTNTLSSGHLPSEHSISNSGILSSFQDYTASAMHTSSQYATHHINDVQITSFPGGSMNIYSTPFLDITTDSNTPSTNRIYVSPTTPNICCSICSTNSSPTKTTEDPLDIIPRQHEDLRVNKTCLSQYIRQHTSARDSRASAEGMGYIGAGILILVIGFIVTLDVLNTLTKKKKNRKCSLSN